MAPALQSALTTYIALLRAINVAGHATVKMDALKKRFAAAGCRNVRTYIQSGNVFFEAESRSAAATFQDIRAGIRALIDGEPEIVFRTLRQMTRLVDDAPFHDLDQDATLKFYVAFLAAKPRARPALPLSLPREALEVIRVKGLDAFIVSRRKPNGFYGFPNNFIESALGVRATTRNWSTVTKIVQLVRNVSPD